MPSRVRKFTASEEHEFRALAGPSPTFSRRGSVQAAPCFRCGGIFCRRSHLPIRAGQAPRRRILVVVVAVVCRAQRSGGCKEDNARATGGAATSWGACCTRIEPESSFSPAGRESRPVMSMKHPCFVRRSRFVLYHGRGVMKRLILDRAPFDGAKAGTATLTCAKDCQDHRPVCRTRLRRIPIPQRLKFQFG